MARTDLRVNLGKLRLRNPTLLAAGILGLTGASLKRVWDAGAGAVVTKSVSLKPVEGYPGPRVVQVRGGLLNAMGLSNPGIKTLLEEIKIAKKGGATIVGSVFGENEEEFVDVVKEMGRANIEAVELNLSCPHVETLIEMGQDPKLTKKIVKEVKKETKILVWVKLPGNTQIPNLMEVAKSAEAAGADAITISNTFPAMALDLEAGRAVLGHGVGGLSGPAIKPISMRLVYELFKTVKIPIIGSGGITTPEDAIEFLAAGASAVQIGTGIMYRGLEIFNEVCTGIQSFMEKKGLKEVSEITGLIHSPRSLINCGGPRDRAQKYPRPGPAALGEYEEI